MDPALLTALCGLLIAVSLGVQHALQVGMLPARLHAIEPFRSFLACIPGGVAAGALVAMTGATWQQALAAGVSGCTGALQGAFAAWWPKAPPPGSSSTSGPATPPPTPPATPTLPSATPASPDAPRAIGFTLHSDFATAEDLFHPILGSARQVSEPMRVEARWIETNEPPKRSAYTFCAEQLARLGRRLRVAKEGSIVLPRPS